MTETLRQLKAGYTRFVVPIWQNATATSDPTHYRVSGYAWVSLEDYSVANPNRISIRYWGAASCPDIP